MLVKHPLTLIAIDMMRRQLLQSTMMSMERVSLVTGTRSTIMQIVREKDQVLSRLETIWQKVIIDMLLFRIVKTSL
jgi:hypothetical protein